MSRRAARSLRPGSCRDRHRWRCGRVGGRSIHLGDVGPVVIGSRVRRSRASRFDPLRPVVIASQLRRRSIASGNGSRFQIPGPVVIGTGGDPSKRHRVEASRFDHRGGGCRLGGVRFPRVGFGCKRVGSGGKRRAVGITSAKRGLDRSGLARSSRPVVIASQLRRVAVSGVTPSHHLGNVRRHFGDSKSSIVADSAKL